MVSIITPPKTESNFKKYVPASTCRDGAVGNFDASYGNVAFSNTSGTYDRACYFPLSALVNQSSGSKKTSITKVSLTIRKTSGTNGTVNLRVMRSPLDQYASQTEVKSASLNLTDLNWHTIEITDSFDLEENYFYEIWVDVKSASPPDAFAGDFNGIVIEGTEAI